MLQAILIGGEALVNGMYIHNKIPLFSLRYAFSSANRNCCQTKNAQTLDFFLNAGAVIFATPLHNDILCRSNHQTPLCAHQQNMLPILLRHTQIAH